MHIRGTRSSNTRAHEKLTQGFSGFGHELAHDFVNKFKPEIKKENANSRSIWIKSIDGFKIKKPVRRAQQIETRTMKARAIAEDIYVDTRKGNQSRVRGEV